jgi:hypothetical protein
MVGTQLYIFKQIRIYNYMFRPCILTIVRLYYKLNKVAIQYVCGLLRGDEISSYSSGWHGLWVTVDRC